MVLGLGIDLVDIPRIEASIQRFGDRFLNRVYTAQELRYCSTRRHPAAKEAAAKALGTGISRGVSWLELEVLREPGRPPGLLLHGRARLLAGTLGPFRASLSLTHTDLHATAVVLLESSLPPGSPAAALS